MTHNHSNNHHTKATASGIAIAAMVVGIVAFFCGVIPFVGFVIGLVAVILSAIALTRPTGKEFAVAGLVTGILGALSSLVVTVIFFMVLVFGGAVIGTIQQSAYEYNAANQAKLEAKKDFGKGETAVFDKYQIKVNSIKLFTPNDDYSIADDGKEFIAVALTIRNVSDEPQQISPYDFKIIDKKQALPASYLSDKEFEQTTIDPEQSLKRVIIYEVTKDAPSLKLGYATQAYDTTTFQAKTLEYTLVVR